MRKASVIVPVYKRGNVKKIVEKILEDPYESKEIIVTADCPDQSLVEELNYIKKYPEVRVIVSTERRGKVKAVNDAVEKSDGDVLIFLDADLEVKKINISKIVEACEKYDLVDFAKVVKPERLLGKMMYVEFILGYLMSKIFSRSGKSVVLCGAGFAVRRDVWERVGGYQNVVSEDFDLATRIYANGGSYFLLDDVELCIFPPKSFKGWIDQRTRWAYGLVEWTTIHYKSVIKFLTQHPSVLLFYLIISNPALLTLPALMVFKNDIFEKLAVAFLIVIVSKYYLLLLLVPLAMLIFITRTLIFLVFYTIVTFIIFTCILMLSKKRVNALWTFLYLYLYSPMYTALIISVALRYVVCRDSIKFNWKV